MEYRELEKLIGRDSMERIAQKIRAATGRIGCDEITPAEIYEHIDCKRKYAAGTEEDQAD